MVLQQNETEQHSQWKAVMKEFKLVIGLKALSNMSYCWMTMLCLLFILRSYWLVADWAVIHPSLNTVLSIVNGRWRCLVKFYYVIHIFRSNIFSILLSNFAHIRHVCILLTFIILILSVKARTSKIIWILVWIFRCVFWQKCKIWLGWNIKSQRIYFFASVVWLT